MTIAEAAEIIRKKWARYGACDACGWHDLAHSYEPLEEWIDQEDIDRGFVELPCHNKDGDLTGHDCLGDVTIPLTD